MRLRFVDDSKGTWPVAALCRNLGVTPAGYYARRGRPASTRARANATLAAEAKAAFADPKGRYGSPRLHRALLARGVRCCVNSVAKAMRALGLAARRPRRRPQPPGSSGAGSGATPNALDRQFAAARCDDKWVSDITAIATGEGWLHPAAVDAPPLAVLDWMMPGLEGPELCRRARALARPVLTYLLLLTTRVGAGDVAAGLDSGADDYVAKPFDPLELASRLRAGERVVGLQRAMADRVLELEAALGQVKQLKCLLPICAYCKSVRDHKNYWQQVETYIAANSDARFSHGICPGYWDEVVVPELAAAGADPK